MTSPLLGYLQGLAENNNKVWFDEHRGEYQVLRQEFASLVGEILARVAVVDPAWSICAPPTVFSASTATCVSAGTKVRTRRSSAPCSARRDATSTCRPTTFTLRPTAKKAASCWPAAACMHPSRPHLAAVRRFILAHPYRLEALLADRAFAAMGGIYGDSLKRPPSRQYRPTHPIWPRCYANSILPVRLSPPAALRHPSLRIGSWHALHPSRRLFSGCATRSVHRRLSRGPKNRQLTSSSFYSDLHLRRQRSQVRFHTNDIALQISQHSIGQVMQERIISAACFLRGGAKTRGGAIFPFGAR